MTKRDLHDEPLVLSADADPLDDLFDQPESRGAARSGARARTASGGSSAFVIAAAASLVWIAAVAAFCWSRFSLPDNPGDAMDVVGARITSDDWMLIAAAILGPLALIWIIAWLMRRTAELKRQSQELANAALRLTQAVQTAEASGAPLALAGRSGSGAEVTDETPRHLRREVERATHAISALHSQMRAIEEALSTQARNIDDVAERAEKRARTIASTLRSEREALEKVTARSAAPRTDETMTVAPAALGAVGTGLAGAAIAGTAAVAAEDDRMPPPPPPPSDVTDFALDEARVEAAVRSDEETLTPAPTFAREEEDAPAPGDSEKEDEIAALRARLAEARANATWETPEPIEPEAGPDFGTELAAEALEPFDDTAAPALEGDDRMAIGAAPGILPSDAYDDLGSDRAGDVPPLNLERRHSIDWGKFTRAANFPESEDDIETLDALYDVLTDPEAASLLQCAEDTLASLADIDLYMEDFTPPRGTVDAWRAHLDGSGGRAIDGIDASVEQSRIRAKLNADKGFEHLAAKFLDRYEEMGRRLLAEAEEPGLITDLSNTRTGRAYLMIAGPAGRLSA